jgi:hypothetical protein
MLACIVLQCRYHYLSMFLTISQPPDLTTEPASWHFNSGDSVCILKGSSVPVVLRQIADTNHYIHLGTCFVSRLMNGDAAGLVREGKVCIQSVEVQ